MANLSTFPKTTGSQLNASEVEKIRKSRVIVLTYGEALTAGHTVYVKASDGKAYKASGNALAEAAYNWIGWCGQTGSTGDTGEIFLDYTPDQSGLTADVPYYLSTTSGAVSATPGTAAVYIGKSISTTEIVREYEMRQTAGTITSSSPVPTSTGGGTTTNTTVTHNLGAVPKMVILSATVTPYGSSNSAYIVGIVAYDQSGAIVWGSWNGTNAGGSMARSQELFGTGTNMSATGVGGVNETVTVSIVSIGATTFTFRIVGTSTSGTNNGSTVTGISWTAIA